MQLPIAMIVAIVLSAAAMAEFICSPKIEPLSSAPRFGGCCQTFGDDDHGQNYEFSTLRLFPLSESDLDCCAGTRATVTSTITVTEANGTMGSVKRYLCEDTDMPESTCCHYLDYKACFKTICFLRKKKWEGMLIGYRFMTLLLWFVTMRLLSVERKEIWLNLRIILLF